MDGIGVLSVVVNCADENGVVLVGRADVVGVGVRSGVVIKPTVVETVVRGSEGVVWGIVVVVVSGGGGVVVVVNALDVDCSVAITVVVDVDVNVCVVSEGVVGVMGTVPFVLDHGGDGVVSSSGFGVGG